MHELGIMNNVLDSAIRVAKENNGHRVTKVTLKVGVLSGILPDYMAAFFDMISQNTIAQGAELIIEIEPAVFLCRDCGEKTSFDRYGPDFICSNCNSENLSLLSGKSFQIVSVAIV